MHGVVSLLDEKHRRVVEDLWGELRDGFGLRDEPSVPFLHFSHHVAAEYDMGALATTLGRVAAGVAPFRIRTTGLGIFTGPTPVLFVPVVRPAPLSVLHDGLWHAVEAHTVGSCAYYNPGRWLPHVTLASADLPVGTLAAVAQQWDARGFEWEIEIDNVALIEDTGRGHVLRGRFPFGEAGGDAARGTEGA